MDRRILNLRLQRIEDELPKITNAILALRITDTEKYPLNYEEVSTDAAIRAEKIACSLRGLIYATKGHPDGKNSPGPRYFNLTGGRHDIYHPAGTSS